MSRAISKTADDETLSNGSIIHWGDPDPEIPKRFMVTCGGCELKRYAYPTKSGLCFPCSRPNRTDDYKLPSGSIIHFGERVLGERKRAMVTCGECGVKHEMWIGDRYRRTIVGFCPTCTAQASIKNPYMRDGLDETLPSGSIVHWGERDPKNEKRAMVTCALCGDKRLTTIQGSEGWTGICFKHRGAADIFEIVKAMKQNGSGQEGSGKRTRGGQAGSIRWDRPQFLADLKTVIQKLYKEGGAVSAVTQEAAAFELNLIGHILSVPGVKNRLVSCGITLGWNDFVISVLFPVALLLIGYSI